MLAYTSHGVAVICDQCYEEISRAHLLDPTNRAGGRDVHWSHPAFANGCVFVRNDRELLCADLRKPGTAP